MPDYDAMKKELPRLRAALTRAKNTNDPQKVIDTVDAAFARFDVIGFPDQWHAWQRAKDDAIFTLQRQNKPFRTTRLD